MSTIVCPKCKILIYAMNMHKCKREQDCGVSNTYNSEDAFMETVSIVASLTTTNDYSSSQYDS